MILGADVIDVLSVVVRRSNTDYALTRVSRDTFLSIPVKTTQGRPFTIFFLIDRLHLTLKFGLSPKIAQM